MITYLVVSYVLSLIVFPIAYWYDAKFALSRADLSKKEKEDWLASNFLSMLGVFLISPLAFPFILIVTIGYIGSYFLDNILPKIQSFVGKRLLRIHEGDNSMEELKVKVKELEEKVNGLQL